MLLLGLIRDFLLCVNHLVTQAGGSDRRLIGRSHAQDLARALAPGQEAVLQGLRREKVEDVSRRKVARIAARWKVYPCLVGAVVKELAAAQAATQRADALGVPADAASASDARGMGPDCPPEPLGTFSRRERFMLHAGIFFVVSWNLVAINLAQSPDRLWFWPWVAAWAAVLMLHLGYVHIASKVGRRAGMVPDGGL